MRFYIVTIFPEYFESALNCGQLKKARDKGLLEFVWINPRDFAKDKHKTVDDKPYGGGAGMVMLVEPLDKALTTVAHVRKKILLSAQGQLFEQKTAKLLAQEKEIVLVCGRYEGIDARLEQLHDLEPISIGDYVLNGGECAALVLIEAVSRFLPGFMSKQSSVEEDSFSHGLLEHPHYTRPEQYKGLRVPEVLLSGHHAKISSWRRQKSLELTLKRRPELLSQTQLTQEERRFLKQLPKTSLGKNLYLALLHHPVLDKFQKVSTTSLTNLDIHDISRVSATFGLGGYFLVTPLKDQQNLAKKLIKHWTVGPSSQLNPDRAKALAKTQVATNLEEVITRIEQQTGQKPVLVATCAREGSEPLFKVRMLLKKHPVLLVFGTGYGLAKEVLKQAEFIVHPIGLAQQYNHLSVRSAVAIMVDRILGEFY